MELARTQSPSCDRGIQSFYYNNSCYYHHSIYFYKKHNGRYDVRFMMFLITLQLGLSTPGLSISGLQPRFLPIGHDILQSTVVSPRQSHEQGCCSEGPGAALTQLRGERMLKPI
eukprot:1184549-Prorocentrum_minimum.AAC.4